jgi:hypothetical protein
LTLRRADAEDRPALAWSLTFRKSLEGLTVKKVILAFVIWFDDLALDLT